MSIQDSRTICSPRLLPIFAFIGVIVGIIAGQDNSLRAQESDESLIGVWEAEQDFNDHQARTVTLQKSDSHWTATVNEIDCAVENQSGKISFELPDGHGKFRGTIAEDDQSVSGFWIQSTTEVRNYPLATPLRFEKKADAWQAKFQPFRDRMRLYLVVSKPEGKPMEAFFRNPERNIGMRIGDLTVKVQNDELKLEQMRGEYTFPGKRVKANGEDSITIELPYTEKPFVFRRAQRVAGSGYYPTETTQPYRYSQPTADRGGWVVAAATEQGFDVSRLEKTIQELRDLETTEITTPYIHSILISRSGKLVLEEYFYGHDRTQTHDTRSAGKSVGSMIVGAVIDKDESLNEHATLASLFGEPFCESKTVPSDLPLKQRSQWRQQITIANALAMQAGLEPEDGDGSSLYSEDQMQNQTAEPDWIKYAMNTPMYREPGKTSFYASNSINLASAAVAHHQAAWLPDLFEAHLAKPLGIQHYHFNLDPVEHGYMGGGIRLRPLDQLKLGQIMLDGGKWNNQQILSQRWVAESIKPHGSIHEPNDYGLAWWRKTLTVGSKQTDVIHASGNGGQLIVCIPEYEMVVQISGGNYSNFPVWYRSLTELIPQKILTAIK